MAAVVLGGIFLSEGSSRWSPRGMVKTGPVSLSGQSQITSSDGGGRWAGVISSIPIRTADDLRYWRAIEAIAEGGVTDFVLPSCESRTAPITLVDGRVPEFGSVPHSDNMPFDDDTEYAQTPVEAYSAAVAAYRATEITIEFEEGLGGPLVGGETFSVEHAEPIFDRRYVVKRLVSDNDDGSQTVKIWPPLREAIVAATYLEFIFPKCLVHLDVPSAMDIEVALRKHASPQMSFVEANF